MQVKKMQKALNELSALLLTFIKLPPGLMAVYNGYVKESLNCGLTVI